MPDNPQKRENIRKDLSEVDKNKKPAPEGAGDQTTDQSGNRKRKNFEQLHSDEHQKNK